MTGSNGASRIFTKSGMAYYSVCVGIDRERLLLTRQLTLFFKNGIDLTSKKHLRKFVDLRQISSMQKAI
jgi:hypothetical protein